MKKYLGNENGESEFQKEALSMNNKYSFYGRYLKRGIDIILSFGGMIVLLPIYLAVIIAIIIDDPGPVMFTQKRIGEGKTLFKLHKFRSMKMSTPHDTPTHMLNNPDQYITRVGKVLRKYSLDELPQIWDIFIGNMSIVGPRPALWNQEDLIAERDKYGANDIKPGLTGWAQINGRDELEIPVKAKLDGEYVEKVKKSSFSGFLMDAKCFFGTVISVAKSEGVIEGGTGVIHKNMEGTVGAIGIQENSIIDFARKKHILITGARSYIGESFQDYVKENYPNNFRIDTVDMIDGSWKKRDFASYDTVFHVAGLAHADVGRISEETKKKYYAVNTDLAIETAQKAKEDGVRQFIFMSSMIVYGESGALGECKKVTRNTVPNPANFYGDSKWQADKGVRALADKNFRVAVLRPPMVYGKGSKGNYPTLAKLAKKLPVFPDIQNERSMLHIDNLCEFLCQIMLMGISGIFIPQNQEYTKTSDMISEIARISNHKIWVTKLFNPMVWIGSKIPGEISRLVNKAFGSMVYDKELSEYPGIDYRVVSLKESIDKTEGYETDKKKHILVVSQYFYPESFRINDMCQEWIKRGYKVTVVTGIPNYPQGKFFEGYGYCSKRKESWKEVEIIRLPLIARGHNSTTMMLNYLSFVVSGFFWQLTTKVKADYVFTFEVSPMTQALIGCWYGKRHKIPSYLYVQDLWPENVQEITGIHSLFVIKPIDKMVDYIYKNTDEIFATSPSFVEAICGRNVKVGKEKVHYWPQYAEEFYKPMKKKVVPDIPDDGKFKVIFTGNIGYAQGLQVLPKTAELLKEQNVEFVIVGDGRYVEEFKCEIAKRNIGHMFLMIPRQPAERIPELLAACDVAFLSFIDTKLFEMTIPAKLQSYMACGMPVIAAARGETKRIIEEAQCGVCCNIGKASDLAQCIMNLFNCSNDNINRMKVKAREFYDAKFDKQVLLTYFEKNYL